MNHFKKFSNLFYALITVFLLSTGYVVYDKLNPTEETVASVEQLIVNNKIKHLSSDRFIDITDDFNPELTAKITYIAKNIIDNWKDANWDTKSSFNDWKNISTPFEGFDVDKITYYMQITPSAEDSDNIIKVYLGSNNLSGALLNICIYDDRIYLKNTSIIVADKIKDFGKKEIFNILANYDNEVSSELSKDIQKINKTISL